MIGILGIVHIVVPLVGLGVSLIVSGCSDGGPPDEPDGGDGDGFEVDNDDDGCAECEHQVSDDGGIQEDDYLPDGDGDVGDQDSSLFGFQGTIVDLDPNENGQLWAYVEESPPALYLCDVDGANNASCNKVADLPFGQPVNYFSQPGVFGVAVSQGSGGNPIDVAILDEGTGGEIKHYHIQDLEVIPGGITYTPTYPLGLAVYQNVHGHDKIFLATNNRQGGQFITSTVLCFTRMQDFSDNIPFYFSGGKNLSSVAITALNNQNVLVALNGGHQDAGEPASLVIYDPEASELVTPLKSIALGQGVEAASLAELALNASGQVAYVGTVAPNSGLARIDLETDAVNLVSVPEIQGRIADIIVADLRDDMDGEEIYVAVNDGASGAIICVGQDLATFGGIIPVDRPPNALSTSGGYLYIGAGDDLMAIDPRATEWQ
jgi:hypothetical protein